MRRMGAAVALAILGAMPVGASVLCQKKASGVVVVRAACKKKEIALDPTQFGAVGPKGDKGDTGSSGTSAVLETTTLTWGGQMTDAHGDYTWRQQRSLGTFTKQSATTRIIATVTGSMSSDAFSCLVQVRIDGSDATGSPDTSGNTSTAGATGQRGPGSALVAPYGGSIVSPFSFTADFGVLPTGMHTVTLWTASNNVANNCSTDPYNYHQGSALIMETGT